MADSLILGGYELIRASQTPPAGQIEPNYSLLPSFDLSEGVPDTSTIEGVILDGDRVTGTRTGNRAPLLPVRVNGTSRLDVAAKVNALRQLIDCQPPNESFPVQWTPDGGLPGILDGYRGKVTRARNLVVERGFATVLELQFPASPFFRSGALEVIDGTAVQQLIDAMDVAVTGATLDTTHKFEGTGSAKFTMTPSTQFGLWKFTSGTISDTISEDLSAFASLGVRFRWPAPGTSSRPWIVHATLTLHDGTHTASTTTIRGVPPGGTAWWPLLFPLSKFGAVDLTAVTSWELSFTTGLRYYHGTALTAMDANADDLRAYPPGTISVSTALGAIVTIPNVIGTAPAPAALTITRGGSDINELALHRPPVEQDLDALILLTLTGTPPDHGVIPAAQNTLNGTYMVVLLIGSLGSVERTVAVTVTQKQAGTAVATYDIPELTYGVLVQPAGRFVVVGQVTLPLVPVAPENSAASIEFDLTQSGTDPDVFLELALFNTRGQLLLLGALPAGTKTVYVDPPDPIAELGQVYASPTDRTAALGMLGWGAKTRVDGGPIGVEPGDNQLLVWSPDGLPDMAATYDPRWHDERET